LYRHRGKIKMFWEVLINPLLEPMRYEITSALYSRKQINSLYDIIIDE
jgi:hypothetical protein